MLSGEGTRNRKPALNPLLSSAQAAAVAKVSTLRLLALARRGVLRIAGQDEAGSVLFRTSEVLRAAQELPARDLYEAAHLGLPPGLLPCGCILAAPASLHCKDNRPRPADAEFLCRDAHALEVAASLAAMFAMAAPDDPFFIRLDRVTRDALNRHLSNREIGERTA